jgi:hypothetical protein
MDHSFLYFNPDLSLTFSLNILLHVSIFDSFLPVRSVILNLEFFFPISLENNSYISFLDIMRLFLINFSIFFPMIKVYSVRFEFFKNEWLVLIIW